MKSAPLFSVYTNDDEFKHVGETSVKTVLSPDKRTFLQARAEADFDYNGCYDADDDLADVELSVKAVRIA